jgi:hypothetical protein
MFAALYKKIDNAPLIAFRIMLGTLLACHCIYYMLGGSMYKVYIKPKFTIGFIGFEWLQPLPGNGMYWYFSIMALFAVFVAIGFMYRYSLAAFTLLFAGIYFMQKTVYNNHHYLLVLLCVIMLFLPAANYASVDSRLNPKIKRYSMPQWCALVLITQMTIVYFFAAIAKLYPDWLNGTFPGILVSRFHIRHLAFILQNHYFHLFIAIGGFFFDLLVVPALLMKKTRNLAAVASVGFHTFNWIILNIGIFPFLALSYLVFFYPPDSVRKLLFRKKPPLPVQDQEDNIPTQNDLRILKYFFIPYFIIQLILPIRHVFIKGDVLWTEEGHRLSWRMMLRFKKGKVAFKIQDKQTGKVLNFKNKQLFTKLQINNMAGKADEIWQAAKIIKEDYAKQGRDVAVYATNKVSINHHPEKLLIDPDTDLTSVPFNYFTHNNWILLYDDYTQ